jgi:hypothetical protein
LLSKGAEELAKEQLEFRGESMSNNSFLKQSDQLWKLNLGTLLLVCGFGLVLFPLVARQLFAERQELLILIMITGLLIGLGGGLWAWFSIKCPSCKARLVWLSFTKQFDKNWLLSLVSLTRCPICSHSITKGT